MQVKADAQETKGKLREGYGQEKLRKFQCVCIIKGGKGTIR